jgi:hypothetical protein
MGQNLKSKPNNKTLKLVKPEIWNPKIYKHIA